MDNRQPDLPESASPASRNGARGNGAHGHQLKGVEIRPSLREDFTLLCGRLPPYTCQSYTALYRGEVVAMGGVTMTKHGYVVCMEMKQDVAASKMTIWRAARLLMSMIAQDRDVIYAGADDKYPNSSKFLEKLGFKYFCTDAQGMEVFVWRTRSQ